MSLVYYGFGTQCSWLFTVTFELWFRDLFSAAHRQYALNARRTVNKQLWMKKALFHARQIVSAIAVFLAQWLTECEQ